MKEEIHIIKEEVKRLVNFVYIGPKLPLELPLVIEGDIRENKKIKGFKVEIGEVEECELIEDDIKELQDTYLLQFDPSYISYINNPYRKVNTIEINYENFIKMKIFSIETIKQETINQKPTIYGVQYKNTECILENKQESLKDFQEAVKGYIFAVKILHDNNTNEIKYQVLNLSKSSTLRSVVCYNRTQAICSYYNWYANPNMILPSIKILHFIYFFYESEENLDNLQQTIMLQLFVYNRFYKLHLIEKVIKGWYILGIKELESDIVFNCLNMYLDTTNLDLLNGINIYKSYDKYNPMIPLGNINGLGITIEEIINHKNLILCIYDNTIELQRAEYEHINIRTISLEELKFLYTSPYDSFTLTQ